MSLDYQIKEVKTIGKLLRNYRSIHHSNLDMLSKNSNLARLKIIAIENGDISLFNYNLCNLLNAMTTYAEFLGVDIEPFIMDDSIKGNVKKGVVSNIPAFLRKIN